MTSAEMLQRDVASSIRHDEIGLAIGQFDGHVLRSAYQPVYRLQGGRLTVVGARALVRPSRDGRPALPSRLFERLRGGDRLTFECLCQALHIANLPFVDLDTMTLALRLGPMPRPMLDAALALLRQATGELEEEGYDPPRIWCECPAVAMAAEQASAVRAHGFRVALSNFGPEPDGIAAAMAAMPDYVRLDGAWFRTVARAPEARSLLARLTMLLHSQGIEVLADGVETTAQFEAALDVGADMYQGFLLAPPFLAGSAFTQRPLRLPELLRPHAKIIPLRRPA
jgi:EAL domain-containing protein (putative c-di-GMP-specific phosphodiesterase class I)